MKESDLLTFDVEAAAERLKGVVKSTPLELHDQLSETYGAEIFLKREDLQKVRSYKIRGAYNKISQLSDKEKHAGVICASAGNHAQGFAFSCALLTVQGTIVMPVTTPKQKVKQVTMFGREWVEIILHGDHFDEAQTYAQELCSKNNTTFIHPFNDREIMEGQATVGLEIIDQLNDAPEVLVLPVGGGGLIAGVSTYVKNLFPNCLIVGVEPHEAPSMSKALEAGKVIQLHEVDPFVDGAAVQKVGELPFSICKNTIDHMVTVESGDICATILELYNRDAIVVEPAGAMTITALKQIKPLIKGKRVVCLLSGSNNDITRMEEMKERAMLYQGLLHYFIIDFPQRAGALKEFVNDALTPKIEIVYFQYAKRTNRESGPVVIGVELPVAEEFAGLIHRFKSLDYRYQYLNDNELLFSTLIG